MSAGTILGIDPGTRFVGVAVIKSGILMHQQVKSFQGVWSEKKLYTVIEFLVATMGKYKVSAVAVKIPDELPGSLGFTQLLGTLNALCERYEMRPSYYTLSDIKGWYCKDRKQNSAALMRVILGKYPELLPEYRKERKNREGYYYKVFEAVAAAGME